MATPAPEPSSFLIFAIGALAFAHPRRRCVESRGIASGERDIRHVVKRVVDVVFASFGLVVSLPILLGAAVAIRIGSPGPIFFVQTRCGKNGRRFRMWKLRSMVRDAEALRRDLEHENVMKGPVFKVPDDPRVTRVGRVLRRFSVDEIPQLWNVLRGEMSLVGPRPPLPAEVVQYGPRERRRLHVKPGLTCTWQVSGRNQIDFDEWMELDLDYVENWSLARDFSLMVQTIPAVLSGEGAS